MKTACRRHAENAHRPLAVAIAATLLLGSMLPPGAAAATSTWNGSLSQDWRASPNWTQPPTGDSSVLIDTVTPNAPRITGSAEDIFYLTVGGASRGALRIDGSGSLHISGGVLGDVASHPVEGLVIGNSVGSVGDVTISGMGSVLTVENHTQVGYDGTGKLSVLNGGTANLGLTNSYIETLVGFGYYASGVDGDRTGSGTINVDGAGSTLNYSGGLNVLNGALNVTGGGQLNSVYRAVDGVPFWVDELGLGAPSNGADFAVLSGTAVATVSGVGSAWNSLNGLSIGDGGDGTLQVLDGATATFHAMMAVGDTYSVRNPDGTSAPYLAGSGNVLVSGQGSTLTLAAYSDAYPGTLTIGAGGTGAMTVSEGGTVKVDGLLNVGEKTNGRLDITSGGMFTVGGSDGNGIGATLGIDAGVQGDVTVTGNGSTFTLDAGELVIGGAGQSLVTVSDSGQLVVPNGIEIGNQGELVVGNSVAGYLPGGIQTPVVDLTDPAATLRFEHVSSDYTFDSRVAGTGKVEVTGGFTQLTADSHTFDGITTVGGGATLSVNGSLGGQVIVNEGGRLQGTGTIGGADIAGTIAPGNSPGTLHVEGDLLMRNTSVYEAQIDTVAGVSDSIDVTGDIAIQPGSRLEVENIGGAALKPGDTIQLFNAGGVVSGQFALVDDPASPFLGYGLSYANGLVTLGVTRSNLSFASLGTTAAARGAGAALDSLPTGSALASVVYGQLTTEARATAALALLPAPFAADVRRVMLDDSRLPRDAVQRRLLDAADLPEKNAVWVQGTGHWGSTDAESEVPKAQSNGSGLIVGTDVGVGPTTRLGVAVGSGQTSYRMPELNASAHITSQHFLLYGRSGFGALGLSYGAAYSWNQMGSNRSFDIGSAHQQLNGDHDAHSGQVFADVGYRVGESNARYLEPFVSAAYVRLKDDGWKEVGTSAALATHSSTDSATFGTLGVRWSVQASSAQLYGNLGWRHVFGFDRAVAEQGFVDGGSTFEVRSLPIAKDAAVIELGAEFALAPHVQVSAGYTGVIGGGMRDSGAKMQLKMSF